MDYGQTQKQDDTPFFTPGAGSEDLVSERPFEPENDLNSGNFSTSPEDSYYGPSAQRNFGAIGQRAMGPNGRGHVPEATPSDSELGHIVNLEMPPGAESNLTLPETAASEISAGQPATPHAISRQDIKTGDHLSPEGVTAVNQAINKLGQDGNIADFYEEVRSMMETNLKNSFNREITA